MEQVAEQIRQGKYPQEGLSFIAHIKGLFGNNADMKNINDSGTENSGLLKLKN